MNLIISTRAELLKTKRTAAFWFTIVGAAFIPFILFIALTQDDNPDGEASTIFTHPWITYFRMGFQILCIFILPMYIILISTLVTQIEYKNNAWKQVFASPQSMGTIFFSKFITIQLMILGFFLLFNILMILFALLAASLDSRHTFFDHGIDWPSVLRYNLYFYISMLGISGIQYWLSLRFKSFLAPVGIGLALLIGSVIALSVKWEHMGWLPYGYAAMSYDAIQSPSRSLLQNHEIAALGYLAAFLLIGFFDMGLRKEKG